MSDRKMQDYIIAAIGLSAFGFLIVKKIRSYITRPTSYDKPVSQQFKDEYKDL